jgi:hypothetical protein
MLLSEVELGRNVNYNKSSAWDQIDKIRHSVRWSVGLKQIYFVLDDVTSVLIIRISLLPINSIHACMCVAAEC